MGLGWKARMTQNVKTDIPQTRVNDPSHLCDSPLDDVTKMLVIYVVVLLAHRSLGTFFEFVLTVAVTTMRGEKRNNYKGVRLTRSRDNHSPGRPSTC